MLPTPWRSTAEGLTPVRLRLSNLLPVLAMAFVTAVAAAARPVAAATPRDTLVVGMATSIVVTLDPAAVYELEGAILVDQLYDKLVDLELVDGRIRAVPEVAESWSVGPDGRTWTFYIRSGIRFPGGRPITAWDVEFSLRRAVRLNQSPAWVLNQLGLEPATVEKTVKALDDRRLQLTLAAPFAPDLVLSILAFPITAVVDREVLKAQGGPDGLGGEYLRYHSAGSGPYRLVRWEPYRLAELEASPGYWRGAPPIRRIVIRNMPDSTAQRLALERGDIDVAWNLPPQTRQELEARKAPGVRIVRAPAHTIEFLAMNTSAGPLASPAVREAVRWAIDYDAILTAVLRREAAPLQTFIPGGYLGHDPSHPFRRDTARARRLLAEAGYPQGFAVELITNGDNPVRPTVAQVLQANLAEVGIRLRINLVQAAALYEKYRQRAFQMILAGWAVDYPDPDALAKPFADASIQQLAWRSGWHDPRATRLTRQAMLEPDPTRRQKLYRELTQLVLLDGPYAILYQPVSAWAVRAELAGFDAATALGTLHVDFTRVSKGGGEPARGAAGR